MLWGKQCTIMTCSPNALLIFRIISNDAAKSFSYTIIFDNTGLLSQNNNKKVHVCKNKHTVSKKKKIYIYTYLFVP